MIRYFDDFEFCDTFAHTKDILLDLQTFIYETKFKICDLNINKIQESAQEEHISDQITYYRFIIFLSDVSDVKYIDCQVESVPNVRIICDFGYDSDNEGN